MQRRYEDLPPFFALHVHAIQQWKVFTPFWKRYEIQLETFNNLQMVFADVVWRQQKKTHEGKLTSRESPKTERKA